MIQYAANMQTKESTNMRGGNGTVQMAALFEEAIPHLRLLSVITLEPGCSIGMHQHTAEAEVFYVLSGEATVHESDCSYTLQAGDAHLCRDGEYHSLENAGSMPARVLAIIPTLAE